MNNLDKEKAQTSPIEKNITHSPLEGQDKKHKSDDQTNQQLVRTKTQLSKFSQEQFNQIQKLIKNEEIFINSPAKSKQDEKQCDHLEDFQIPGDEKLSKNKALRSTVPYKSFKAKVNKMRLLMLQYDNIEKTEKDELIKEELKELIRDRFIYDKKMNNEDQNKKAEQILLAIKNENYDRAENLLNEQMPLSTQSQELQFLGKQIPIYFLVIKYCMVILLIMLCISGLSNMFVNYAYGSLCEEGVNSDCSGNYVTRGSLGNIGNNTELLDVLQMEIFATTIMIIVLFQFFRRDMRQMAEQIDTNLITPEDFALLVRNIPEKLGIGIESTLSHEECQNLLSHSDKDSSQENLISERASKASKELKVNVDITSVVRLKDYSKATEFKKEMDKNIQEKKKIYSQKKKTKSEEDIKNDIDLKNQDDKIQKNCEQIHKFLSCKHTDINDTAIISYATMYQKDRVLKKYKEGNEFIIDKNVLKFEHIGSPDNIIWDNIRVTKSQKLVRSMISKFLILVTVLAAFYIIEIIQSQTYQTQYINGISMLVAALTIFLNSVLYYFMNYIVNYETSVSKTDFQVDLIFGLALVQFLNTGLSQIFVRLQYDLFESYYILFFGQNGIIFNQNNIFLANIYIPLIFGVLNIGYQIKRFNRYLNAKNKHSNLTQQELDRLSKNPEFNLTSNYASIIQTMYMTAFYSIMLPIGILWSILALLVVYWVSKYQLLRHSVNPINYSIKLGVEIIEMLEHIIPLYGLSAAMFIIFTTNDNGFLGKFSLFWIALCLVHNFLPMQKVNEYLFDVKEHSETQVTYHKAKESWGKDFDYEEVLYNYYGIEKNKEKSRRSSIIPTKNQIGEQQSEYNL